MSREPARTDLARWLVDTAVRRWPAELRTDLSAEWAGELWAMDREPVGPLTRRWRKLRFAVSLAVARPVEPAGQAPRGWREHVVGGQRVIGALLALVLVPYVLSFVAWLSLFVMALAGMVAPAPVDRVALSVSTVLAVLGAAFTGGWLARQAPLVPVGEWRHRSATCAVAAGVALLIGALGVSWAQVLASGSYDRSPWAFHAAGTGVASLAVLGLAVPAARRLVRGRGWRSLAAPLVVAFVAVDIGVAVAGVPGAQARGYPLLSLPLWLPMDLFANSWQALIAAEDASPGAFSPAAPMSNLLMLPKTLMYTAAFGVAYVVALQRLPGGARTRRPASDRAVGESGTAALATTAAPTATPVGPLTDPPAGRLADLPVRPLTDPPAGPLGEDPDGPGVASGAGAGTGPAVAVGAVALAMVGVLVWAMAAAGLLTPTAPVPDDAAYFLAYPAGMRYSAIILAVLGLAVAAARVGAVVAPSLVFGAALLGSDVLLELANRQGPRYAVAAAVLGTVLGALALRLSPVLAGGPRSDARRRHLLAGLAVLAAFSAPAVPGHGDLGLDAPGPPPWIWPAALLVSALLVVLAATCALAARPVDRRRVRPLPVAAAVAAVAVAVATASTGGFGYPLGVVLAVAALSVVRFSPRRPARSAGFWLAMGVLAGVAAIPVWFLTNHVGGALTTPLVLLAHDPGFVGGTSTVLGAPAAGLIFAALFNRRPRGAARPDRAPAPAPAPVPAPEVR